MYAQEDKAYGRRYAVLPVDVRVYRSLAYEETIIITLTTNLRIASRHERRIPRIPDMNIIDIGVLNI